MAACYLTRCFTCNRTIKHKRLTIPVLSGEDMVICERCYHHLPSVVSKNISNNIFHNKGHEYNKGMIYAFKNSSPLFIYNKGYVLLISVNGERQFKKFYSGIKAAIFLKNNRNTFVIDVFKKGYR